MSAPPSKTKPVVLLTHSRACSTAIERVFWTNPKIICFHEEFGGAYYYGPERVSDNWKYWTEDHIAAAGHGDDTYRSALETLIDAAQSREHVFLKDMSYHLIPPKDCTVRELPSLVDWDDGAAHLRQNPTWLPTSVLNRFQFAFLIRSPWLAIPSLYRLHVPPMVHETQLGVFKPAEVGYREIRILIEYLYPHTREHVNRTSIDHKDIITSPVIIDASHVLKNPEEVLADFCRKVGLPFDVSMLSWEPDGSSVKQALNKFKAFHHDALSSGGLRQHAQDEEMRKAARKSHAPSQDGDVQHGLGMDMTEAEYIAEWTERYGAEAAMKILDAVDLCKDDYIWLKQFVIEPRTIADESAQ